MKKAVVVFFILLTTLFTSMALTKGEINHNASLIVPLYTDPSVGKTWNTLIETKLSHPSLTIAAIINPDSGPGHSKDPNYISGTERLNSAGVLMLGYVPTTYSDRPLAQVSSDIDKWKKFYPQVHGIFFDEQSNTPGKETYYQQASSYAKSKGFNFTIGNPGTNTVPTYLKTVDVVLIYESAGVPNLNDYKSWIPYDKRKLGMIPYGVPSLPVSWINSAIELVGWIYVTDDVAPNPWDSLPSYFNDMATLLASA